MTLQDVTEFIIDTKHNTPKFTDNGYPCIRTPNIGRGFIQLENVKRVSEKSYNDWISRATPAADDLILAREAPVGNVAIIPKGIKLCHGQRTVLIRANLQKVVPRFLMYLLLSEPYQNLMHGKSGGATVAHLNMSDIRNLPIDLLPSLIAQSTIASILSAYDNLIENNIRRIQILEQMAQAIYKEWFVNFRFPGHENVKFVDSSLGKIPEGWEVKTIGEVCKVGRGSSPRPINDKRYFENGEIPWIKIADATASGKFIYETKEKVNEFGASFSRIMEKGSLIVATSGTLGFSIFLGVKGCIHDGWLYMSEYKNVSPSFLFFVINSNRESFNNQSYGAAIQNINTDILRNTPFIMPDMNTLDKFVGQIKIFDSEIDLLSKKNILLRRTRDLLLPKLMSGEVEV